MIIAAVADTFGGAHFTGGKALTIHFEAFGFLADATCSFFLGGNSGLRVLGKAFLLVVY